MIYQKQFIKETTLTAMAIFLVVLAILVFTQGINLLGRAADGRVAVDAVAALIGFWTVGMTPLLLVLTAYISTLTVLTRYWRDSEMSIWLASGLGLRQWIKPVLTFALPLALVVAVMQLAVLPWAELRSREYAEILKQKQNLSLVEEGRFAELGKKMGACILWKNLIPTMAKFTMYFWVQKVWANLRVKLRALFVLLLWVVR